MDNQFPQEIYGQNITNYQYDLYFRGFEINENFYLPTFVLLNRYLHKSQEEIFYQKYKIPKKHSLEFLFKEQERGNLEDSNFKFNSQIFQKILNKYFKDKTYFYDLDIQSLVLFNSEQFRDYEFEIKKRDYMKRTEINTPENIKI